MKKILNQFFQVHYHYFNYLLFISFLSLTLILITTNSQAESRFKKKEPKEYIRKKIEFNNKVIDIK